MPAASPAPNVQIPALMHGAAQPPAGERIQLVLIGGLSGKQEDADAALAALQSYCAAPGLSERVGLSAVPCGNPDGLALANAPENGAGGNPSAGYPPPGDSYYDANPEAHYLWRWVSFQGPDLAVEIRVGAGVRLGRHRPMPAAVAAALFRVECVHTGA